MVRTVAGIALILILLSCPGVTQQSLPRYYAHEAVEDEHGVIAPWYAGQNGQCDLRARIAAETLKRYPWALNAPTPAPHYVYSGAWRIAPDGTITIPPIGDWANGDLGQRAAYVLLSLVDYYRYSGDPAAIAHISLTADVLLDHMQTGPAYPWARFLISVPVKGKPYGKADPRGMIQLDIVAEVGLGMVRAFQMVGNERWLKAAKHWADVLAMECDLTPGAAPWGRYANPEDAPWGDLQTGGVVFILEFFDSLIDMGYEGRHGALLAAREAGGRYLNDELLPLWAQADTWARNYWDWENYLQAENVTEFAVRYMMERPDEFPNWRADCRNIMNLFIHRSCAAPGSGGDVYSGAWAYPEGPACCGRSLWYGPMELATVYAEYGVLAEDEWAAEMARRQMILATYDMHETGVVEDNIDGGAIVAGSWFKIAHPMALRHVLAAIAWMPGPFGAGRENHIVRSSSVVRRVVYGDGRIEYETFDAPPGCEDVLRLSYKPKRVTADGKLLAESSAPDGGWEWAATGSRDFIVTIRHEGSRHIAIEGDDPQQSLPAWELDLDDKWSRRQDRVTAATSGAVLMHRFTGNQVRVMGSVGPAGGLADVYVDGEKQLVSVDCWSPRSRHEQVLYYRNGLPGGSHEIRIVARGEGNPASPGSEVAISGVQWSNEDARGRRDVAPRPTQPQRVILGYPKRTDYVSQDSWAPATELVVRTGNATDPVDLSWWMQRRVSGIAGTRDPELFRYGVHAPEFTAYFTLAPGEYDVRLLLAETRRIEASQRVMDIEINGEPLITALDIAATAGGFNRAAELVFRDVATKHGVIAIRFRGTYGGEAICQAIEVGEGIRHYGVEPVTMQAAETVSDANLLVNPGFEQGAAGTTGRVGESAGGFGWTYVFASPSRCYIWGESAYSIHPETGLPDVRTGEQALRTHTDGDGHTMVYQDVLVMPDTQYRASGFVQGIDLHGKGFGATPGDSAGLAIQELDARGNVIAEHSKAEITEAGDYTERAVTFTTTANSTRVRFILDTRIGGHYNEGHVTYDDCALQAVGEPD